MTDLSLLSISAISFYLLGNNVTSCHRHCTHCHHSNSVDLLIVLIIRNTDDKSWDAHFHIQWGLYCSDVQHLSPELHIFCNFLKSDNTSLQMKTSDKNGFFFNHCTHSTAAGGEKVSN